MNKLKSKWLIVLKKTNKQQDCKKKKKNETKINTLKYSNKIKIKQQKKPLARTVVIITNK